MPTESDLRDLFRGPDGDGSRLEAGEIVRRAHRRRTPKVIAATAGAFVVLAAVVVPVAGIGISQSRQTSAGSSVESAPDLGRSGGRSQDLRAPAAPRQSACAAPTPAPSDSTIGASVDAVDAAVGAPVSGALVLRGSGSASEVRVTGPVSLTVLSGDDILWSGTTDLGSPRLSLTAEGEARLPFTVRVVDCGSGAVLPAGQYRIVASVPVSVDGAAAQRVGGEGTLRIG